MDKAMKIFEKIAQLKINPTYRLAGKLNKRFTSMGKRRALKRAKKIEKIMRPTAFEWSVPVKERMDILQKYIRYESPSHRAAREILRQVRGAIKNSGGVK